MFRSVLICVLPPTYEYNLKPYCLILVNSYQYDLFSKGWFEFWCPKASARTELWNFNSVTLESPSCY